MKKNKLVKLFVLVCFDNKGDQHYIYISTSSDIMLVMPNCLDATLFNSRASAQKYINYNKDYINEQIKSYSSDYTLPVIRSFSIKSKDITHYARVHTV